MCFLQFFLFLTLSFLINWCWYPSITDEGSGFHFFVQEMLLMEPNISSLFFSYTLIKGPSMMIIWVLWWRRGDQTRTILFLHCQSLSKLVYISNWFPIILDRQLLSLYYHSYGEVKSKRILQNLLKISRSFMEEDKTDIYYYFSLWKLSLCI